MTVNISKPAVNVRSKLAELDKPTGIAGEAMLRAETPQEQFNLIGAGRRNLIINGENKISQRGDYTSATAISDNAYYIDRWKSFESNVATTLTHKQNQSLPDGSVSHTQRYDVTTGAAGYFGARQIIEEPLTEGRVYTLSAWVKSNNSDMNLYSENGDYRKHHSGSGEWEKLSLTFIATGLSNRDYGFINYTAAGQQPTAAGDFVEFTQVQLELGKVATPFEHRSIGEELAACKRYYYRIDSAGANGTYYRLCDGMAISSTVAVGVVRHPVEMRAIPSLSSSAGGTWATWDGVNVRGATYAITASGDGETNMSSMLDLSGVVGMTQFTPVQILANANKTAFIAYDAEL